MNRKLKVIIASAIALLLLYYLGKSTNAFRFFTYSSAPSNYPTLKPRQLIIVSNRVKPHRFSFVCYEVINEMFDTEFRVSRLCGLEGDKVEIKDGTLYLNDVPSDSAFSLAHDYIVSTETFDNLSENMNYDEFDVHFISEDSVRTYVSDIYIRENSVPARLVIMPKDSTDEMIYRKFQKNWNADHFGPVTVPKGMCFLLGDNRHRSLDSRYSGFIEMEKITGTVLFH